MQPSKRRSRLYAVLHVNEGYGTRDIDVLMRAMPTIPATDETLIYGAMSKVANALDFDTYDMTLVLLDHLGKERLQSPKMGKSVHRECSNMG